MFCTFYPHLSADVVKVVLFYLIILIVIEIGVGFFLAHWHCVLRLMSLA